MLRLHCNQYATPLPRLANPVFGSKQDTLQGEAAAKNEVYMVDKQQVQKTRRTLFGLPLPNLGLFGGGDDDDDNKENQISELESTVKSASFNGEGWIITIAEGSTWQQMDFSPLALSPKPGMPVVIKRAALGTYKMSVRKQPGIKVKRIY